ncbi:MAG: D-beta-D-heptose 1-phosphate adenosyltransferase, partial [Spirochaetes bacterium]|nr:D-beta-D-heptose 1-phosphate adenosyltransferase [Spirochaetota bacterium]
TLKIDLCFIGADAVALDGQCLVTTPEEASLTRTMLRRAGRRVLLADHTKVDAGGPGAAYGGLGDFHLWITTPGIDPGKLDTLRRFVTIKEATT